VSQKSPAKNESIEAEEIQVAEPPKPVYPQFEDQLKQIREGYAKEYEDKISRGLQELNDLKTDISQKQEVFDSK
jgi:hypothetical protein